jgi:hypothetical protein
MPVPAAEPDCARVSMSTTPALCAADARVPLVLVPDDPPDAAPEPDEPDDPDDPDDPPHAGTVMGAWGTAPCVAGAK